MVRHPTFLPNAYYIYFKSAKFIALAIRFYLWRLQFDVRLRSAPLGIKVNVSYTRLEMSQQFQLKTYMHIIALSLTLAMKRNFNWTSAAWMCTYYHNVNIKSVIVLYRIMIKRNNQTHANIARDGNALHYHLSHFTGWHALCIRTPHSRIHGALAFC